MRCQNAGISPNPCRSVLTSCCVFLLDITEVTWPNVIRGHTCCRPSADGHAVRTARRQGVAPDFNRYARMSWHPTIRSYEEGLPHAATVSVLRQAPMHARAASIFLPNSYVCSFSVMPWWCYCCFSAATPTITSCRSFSFHARNVVYSFNAARWRSIYHRPSPNTRHGITYSPAYRSKSWAEHKVIERLLVKDHASRCRRSGLT